MRIQPWPDSGALSLADDDLHLYLCAADRFDDAVLSAEERERAKQFRFLADEDRFKAARSLLRERLGAYIGVRPADLVLRADRHGKPYVPGAKVHFNLSHAAGVVLLGFGLAPLGVDVEQIRPVKEPVESYFTAEERQLLESAAPGKRERMFFQLWTRKEAVLKALGTGLFRELDTFQVGTGNGEGWDSVQVHGEKEALWLQSFSPSDGTESMLAAVCSRARICPDVVLFTKVATNQ